MSELEILQPGNVEVREEFHRAIDLVKELVAQVNLRCAVGREPFDINISSEDLLAAAEEARDQLVKHLIEPMSQAAGFDPRPRMPVMPERPPDPEDPA
jgi:hypothetical protein